jgi:His/Glu/Gln/Arg/opine family amino acid ABC transporter permease subunit
MGTIIGLVIALLRISQIRVLRAFAGLYINFFRGIPQMVYLVWLYFGISMALNIDLNPLLAASVALSTQYGGYLAEIYRSGIEAVGRGQTEAAVSMGLTTGQTYRHIVLPQAIRIVIPPVGNMWVGAVKDSSLVSYLGVMELMRTTMLHANLSWRPFEFYTTAAFIYVLLVWLSAQGVSRLERSFKYEVI